MLASNQTKPSIYTLKLNQTIVLVACDVLVLFKLHVLVFN